MSQQVSNQRAVVADFFCSFSIADTSRADDAAVISHHIDEANEAVVQHREFLPAERFDLSLSFSVDCRISDVVFS